jgi:hypothetical protein
MSQKRIQQIERRIDRIKRALLEIGPMRPGSLTRQYKDPQHHTGAYWQISYTRQMKSRTEYVRKEYVKEVRRQTVTHKRFKRLVEQWIDLSIEHSRLTMKIADLGPPDRLEFDTLKENPQWRSWDPINGPRSFACGRCPKANRSSRSVKNTTGR